MMAEHEFVTPNMVAYKRDYFATPDNWEMRAEETPTAGNVAKSSQEPMAQSSTPWELDGMSNSFTFCGFGAFETPPGALMYQNQFNDSCNNGSFVDYGVEEDMELAFSDETDEPEIITEGKHLELGPCGDSNKSIVGIKKDVSEEHIEIHHENLNETLPSPSPSKLEEQKVDSSEEKNIKEKQECLENGELTTNLSSLSADIQQETQAEYASDVTPEQVTHSYVSLRHDSVVMVQSPNDIEECILERMDQEDMNANKDVGEISSQQNELSPFPKDEQKLMETDISIEKSQPTGISSMNNIEDNPNLEVKTSPCIEDHCEIEKREFKNSSHSQGLANSQLSDINASLMSMDIPHNNAAELDQLAEFLKMDDLFGSHENQDVHDKIEESSDKNKETIANEQSIVAKEVEQVPSPKKIRKKRKSVAMGERRRSVRIARRESLQMGVLPTFSDVDDPEVATDDLASTNLHKLSKKGAGKSNRRPSVRPQQTDITIYTTETASAKKENNSDLKSGCVGTCDKAFLADFADFGLGDDWMPGNMFEESDNAKTPKSMKTPGRRKSSRLSGVPIPMLELHGNSTVKVAVVEDMVIDDDSCDIQNGGCVWETTSAQQAEESTNHAPPDTQSSAPQNELLGNFDDLSFEQFGAPVAKSRGRKKKVVCERRRSVRLATKPKLTENEETAVKEGTQPKSGKSGRGRGRKKQTTHIDCSEDNLQEMKGQDLRHDTISESEQKSETSNMLQPDMAKDSEMEWQQQQDKSECVEDICDSTVNEVTQPIQKSKVDCVAKDTPFMGRKRVSRVQDKELDDNVEPGVSSSETTESYHEPERDTETDPLLSDKENCVEDGILNNVNVTENISEVKLLGERNSPSPKIKITKKVRQLYLNKGEDLKKHKTINLETIFESPQIKGKGQPTSIGGKRIKRVVAFTETPWLGRQGRTKGRKTRKCKAVKRVLTSTKDRCWKLDTKLSTLENISP